MLSFRENTADNGVLTLTYLADVDDSKKLSLGISAPLLEAIVNACPEHSRTHSLPHFRATGALVLCLRFIVQCF
jgi:hypothetical protein